MRFALVMVALLACKVKEKKAPASTSEPPTVEVKAPIGSDSATPLAQPPHCEEYAQVTALAMACTGIPDSSKQAMKDGLEAIRGILGHKVDENTQRAIDDACKQATDALRLSLAQAECATNAPTPSRNVPSEKGVPLDRAVLGSLPHPFGALQPIKPTMTLDEILHAIPDARRDGENLTLALGVEALTAKILIDSSNHISDIEIPMAPFPSDLFEQAWGASPNNVWFDRVAMWRADYGGDDNTLHIFPYKRLVDVIGTGPDLLAEQTPLIGKSITSLKEKFGGRIDEWTEEDDEGNEITRPRFLVPSTEICHFDSLYVLQVEDDIVTGATFTQCYDGDADRKSAMAAMEQRWGRATPARTKDDRLVFRFSRPGRTVEMTEDPTVDPAGAWVVKIRR